MPLTMRLNSSACDDWCLRAPSAIVLKNSFASDFMISATLGFLELFEELLPFEEAGPDESVSVHPAVNANESRAMASTKELHHDSSLHARNEQPIQVRICDR